jgi:starch synthase
VHLIQAGWYPTEELKTATMQLASEIAPSVKVHNIGSVTGQGRTNVFAASDIFISLTDNIQETFGLSVIEAMSCGVPVIVTDWDGYRDTVRHGETGFRVSTMMAPSGSGGHIGQMHGAGGRPYNRYLMDVSQATAVDIRQATEFIVRLAKDQGLRHRMGQAGRRRAVALYDWSVVIPEYQALWAELDQRRQVGSPIHTLSNPRHPDPFWLFSEFASRTLNTFTTVRLAQGAQRLALIALRSPTLRSSSDLLVSDEIFRSIVQFLERNSVLAVDAIVDLYPMRGAEVLRSIMWGIKVGIFEVVEDDD